MTLVTTVVTMTRCHHFLLLHITVGLPSEGHPYNSCCSFKAMYLSCWTNELLRNAAVNVVCSARKMYWKMYCCRASSMAPVPCLAECTVRASFLTMPTCLPGCEKNDPEEWKGGALPSIGCLDKQNQFQICSWEFCLRSVRHVQQRALPL